MPWHLMRCQKEPRPWERALSASIRPPNITNTDQETQFTSEAYIEAVESVGIEVSMDVCGRWTDYPFIERLRRKVKYKDVYLNDYVEGLQLGRGLA